MTIFTSSWNNIFKFMPNGLIKKILTSQKYSCCVLAIRGFCMLGDFLAFRFETNLSFLLFAFVLRLLCPDFLPCVAFYLPATILLSYSYLPLFFNSLFSLLPSCSTFLTAKDFMSLSLNCQQACFLSFVVESNTV